MEIRPGGATGLVSVRFRPWGGYFLGMPVRELADRVVDARDVWGASAVAELEERLASAADTERRFELVETFLIRQLGRHAKDDVEGLVRAVWARGGRVRVGRLSRELGVAERSLERTFARAPGMTPKGYTKLSRFLRACALIRSGGDSLTRLAQLCGYYDQSHFIGDFKAFAGLTPSQFQQTPGFSFLEID